MENNAPIALFVYNRLLHTQKTVASLQSNILAEQSDLIIYCDGSKNSADKAKVDDVRQYVKSVSGFKSVTVVEREENIGLSNSIITGITETVNNFGKIIIVEDDLLLSKYFLKYMNAALNYYENERRVISIHGYWYPSNINLPETFFLCGADCWGWGTWKRSWDLLELDGVKLLNQLLEKKLAYKFEYNGTLSNIKMLKNQISGKVNSWAVRWHAVAVLNNMLTLYPGKSLVKNIGVDGTGTNTKKTSLLDTVILEEMINVSTIPVEENITGLKAVEKYMISTKPNFIKIMLKKILKNHYYEML